jgi:hypothetical protein
MALMLRGGIGDTGYISAKAVTAFLRNPDREPERTSRPKTKRAMKRKIVRGKKGAASRGAIVVLRETDDAILKVTTKLIRQ